MFVEFINDYLKSQNGEVNAFGKILILILIFLTSIFLSRIISKIIKKNVYAKQDENSSSYMRLVTIVGLLDKVIKIVIYFFAIIISMDVIGLNPGSIIATIGVGSLALSFGAQSLVKDVINGFFIIVENQFSVGDLVEIEKYKGYVEELGIRSTKIRDFAGDLHIIPNGNISIVTNRQRGNMRAKIIFSVDISESPNKIIDLLKNKISYLEDDNRVVRGPNIWGVTNNTSSGYEVTIVVFAKPGSQFEVEYEIREKVVEIFIDNNIKLPKFRTEVFNDASI